MTHQTPVELQTPLEIESTSGATLVCKIAWVELRKIAALK